MHYAAETGTIIGQIDVVHNPIDIDTPGIFVSFAMRTDGPEGRVVRAYRRLTPSAPSLRLAPGARIEAFGPVQDDTQRRVIEVEILTTARDAVAA